MSGAEDALLPVTSSIAVSKPVGRPRARLLRKYALLFIALVATALLLNSGSDFWFSYKENMAALVGVQQEKADAAAQRIQEFVNEIKGQIGWTTLPQWDAAPLDQRQFDYIRLLRQVPPITELSELDADGKEQLRVSRVAMDAVGSGKDFSASPAFTQAKAQGTWFSPVYFRKESEPYMTLAIARAGKNAGVTVAEINLKLIWDVITALKIGQGGYAYVVDQHGRLIAHPDISLVLRDTDLSRVPQVAHALTAVLETQAAPTAAMVAKGIEGRSVLTAHAAILPLGWLVFVEVPLSEAFAPLYGAAWRTGLMLILGLLAATFAALVLARRMTGPIRRLQAGAARIGAGELDRRIDIHTGDELEELADQFNRMSADLQKSYADLERKVEERTAELSEALDQQTATAEVLQIINSSPGNLAPVFGAMLERAMRLCEAAFGMLWTYDGNRYHAPSVHGAPAAFVEFVSQPQLPPYHPGSGLGRMLRGEDLVIHDDMAAEEAYWIGDPLRRAIVDLGGARTAATVSLRKDQTLLGAFTVYRQEVRPFSDKQIALLQSFAAQAVIAIENARLLDELRESTDELARSVEELKAVGEVGQAVSSTLDLRAVLSTILARSVDLARVYAGVIFRYSRAERTFHLVESVGWDDGLVRQVRELQIDEGGSAMGQAVTARSPVQLPDLAAVPTNPLREATLAAGFHAVLVVPLVGAERILGAMVLARRTAGEFTAETVRLMQTIASQSVLAIQNARLFREIAAKSEELALASQHKSQFLANMSHELRTPLNAILGYAELLVDGIYGELPEKAHGVLERVQNNGKHLLALINDVLDLAKIEAGQLVLTLDDYAMPDVVRSVVAATEPLATTKGLRFTVSIADGMPAGYGDMRRLSQVLLNLVGNAVKFTDGGEIAIQAAVETGRFVLTVRDTGPGIAPEDQDRIFEEFRQVDNSNTRAKGGTGLGLAISKRMVEVQGGAISVELELGRGSTFRVSLPIRVEEGLVAA